jgi:hypothetical protein
MTRRLAQDYYLGLMFPATFEDHVWIIPGGIQSRDLEPRDARHVADSDLAQIVLETDRVTIYSSVKN